MRVRSELVSLPSLLRWRAQQTPDATFVRRAQQSLSYAEFDLRTDAIAAGLRELGVRDGDVVSVFLPNCIEFLEAWWGILKAGAVFGPVNPAYVGPEASYVIGHSEAVAVVTGSAGAAVIAPHRSELPRLRAVIGIDADASADVELTALSQSGAAPPPNTRAASDLAAILYTSGTTGRPKGAMLTHGSLLVNTTQVSELVPLAAGERVGMLLPLFHANAQLVTTLVPMMVGCEVVMWERFSASGFWNTVAEYEPVTISAVPMMLAAVLAAENAPGRDNSLRYVICGAAPLSVEMLNAFQERFGISVLEGYGLTETSCVASINPFYGERKAGSIGLPVRGQQMRIVDPESGSPLAQGGYGEIVIKGPNLMSGYLKNPQATDESIRDGWLHTGDIGQEDEDGYFFIVDRSKDMIIRGGENIYPREIEEVLYAFPGIQECAVIGLPDPVRGEQVMAIVVANAGATLDLDALAAHAAQRLARYKLPTRYELADALPKTPTGKITKGTLRDRYSGPA